MAPHLSMEAPATEMELVATSQRQKSQEYHVGVLWMEGLGKYKLTKVITLTPCFLINNNLSETISFQEHGVAPKDWAIIKPGQRSALQIMHASQEKLLTVVFPGLNAQWYIPTIMLVTKNWCKLLQVTSYQYWGYWTYTFLYVCLQVQKFTRCECFISPHICKH